MAGSLLINKLFPPNALSAAQTSPSQESPTYGLSGGQNRLRPYEPLPLLLGSHIIFPDLGAKPYTEFEGDDQYLYQVFDFGPGDIALEDFRIGETPISAYMDVTITHAENGVLPGFFGNVDTTDAAPLEYESGWVMRATAQDTIRIAIDIVGIFYAFRDD